MPKQLPKEIFNLISDRAGAIKCVEAYTKVILFCTGKIPAYILDDLLDSANSFNSSIKSIELELSNNGYAFDQLEQLTAIVDAVERNKSHVGGDGTP